MKDSQSKNKKAWVSSLSLALQLGYTIALPLVALALAGRFLDKKFGTSPWLLISGVIISLIITSWFIFIKINKIMSDLDRCDSDTKKIQDKEEK